MRNRFRRDQVRRESLLHDVLSRRSRLWEQVQPPGLHEKAAQETRKASPGEDIQPGPGLPAGKAVPADTVVCNSIQMVGPRWVGLLGGAGSAAGDWRLPRDRRSGVEKQEIDCRA